MAEKNIGSKILGLFVETGGGAEAAPEIEGGKSAADLVAELAQSAGGKGQAAPDGAPLPPASAPMKFDRVPAAPSGDKVNFEEIFSAAGMDPAELDRVKKAEELLRGLPPGTPDAVKRQIVEASLKAFGFDLAKIVQAAQNQIRAVDAYVRVNETATAKAVTDAQAEIQRLNEKIAAMRADIDKRNGALASLSAQAQVRKGEVQKVIDFFQAPSAPAAQGT